MQSSISRTPRQVSRSASLLVTLLVVALGIAAGILYAVQLLAPLSADKHAPTVLVTIPPGKSARQIGEILARKHLIRKAYSFVLASRMDHLSGEMRAGRYELSPAMPPRQIAALMVLGETATRVVTIPGGLYRASDCASPGSAEPGERKYISAAGAIAGADVSCAGLDASE